MLATYIGKLAFAMSSFSDRLNLATEGAKKSRAQLAAVLVNPKTGEIGVSPQAVGDALLGKTKMLNAENAARAARFLGVSIYWLCTGEGSMKDSDVLPRSAAVAKVLEVLNQLSDQQVAAVADKVSILAALSGRGHLQVHVSDAPPAAPIGSPAEAC